MSKPYYITTAIVYTSGKPHIGNLVDPILADVLARFQRLRGRDVYYLTGTDEHGVKVQEKAQAEGIEPQELVDRLAAEVKRQWDLMNTDYNQFIRTTDPKHKAAVQKIFKRFFDNGDIYKGSYEGLYCKPDETFYTEKQAGENKVCPECGAKLVAAKEEAYFFKLSKYANRLIEHYDNNPDFILPASRKNEMIENFLKPGLQDLCVSRTSFTWGVPVEFDPGHVVYVWVDALSNYITALGYDPDGNSDELFNKYWPAQIQVIGKDILRFHAIYWPIFLMALDLPLPETILVHPWILTNDAKMSKSKGNVVYADELAERYGADVVRYVLMREMTLANDASLTREKFVGRVNADLANDLGNLLSRTVAMTEKYFGGTVPVEKEYEPLDKEIETLASNVSAAAASYYESGQTANALAEIWKLISRANKYIDETMPWVLGKDESKKARLAAVLGTLCEVLRGASVFIEPTMPMAAKEIRRRLGQNESLSWEQAEKWSNEFTVTKGDALFPRLVLEEELAFWEL
ncbi:MAG: methionine--tRNA ligase [Oscillospiraceae bacterium]|nr:methionine--tRNA ligase [Oscillospiraceae bacterium]